MQPPTQVPLNLASSAEPSEERPGEDIGLLDDPMDDEEDMNFGDQPDANDIYK